VEAKISIDRKLKTVLVHCSGEIDFEGIVSLIKSVLLECNKEGFNHVLLDGRKILNGNLASHKRFIIGEAIAKTWQWNLKAAFIYPQPWINKLAETVANNRGANIFVTHDLEAAKKWLYSQGD
jgi:hypothetical protein